MEEWRLVEDFPNYEVNDHGDIRKVDSGYNMSVRLNNEGFPMINLMRDGRQFTRSVPLLVAKAFLEPPPTEYFDSVIHLDGDRENMHVSNLMWRPRWFVNSYHRMFKQKPINMAVYLTDTDEVFENIRDACVKYGLIEKKVFIAVLNREPVWPLGYVFLEYRE